MPGNASFPSFGDQSSVPGGRDDDVRDSVGSEVSAAKFVDNSVHHGVYDRDTDSITGRYMSISRPTNTDFQVTHERTYDFTEENNSVSITHSTAHGVNEKIPPFFGGTQLLTGATPPMFLFSYGDRIKSDSITTLAESSRVNLNNMKGNSLGDLGFDTTENQVRGGQFADVGLRTTDLAMRIFRNKMHGLNSVSLGLPFAGPRVGEVTTYKGAGLVRHSTNFLAQDFRSQSIPDSLRFIARHDNYILFCDRFGNFIYAPNGFSHKDRKITDLLASNITREEIVDAANRVIITGNNEAINDDIQAFVDDVEMQKRDGIVKTMSVTDPTVNSRTAARQSANQILRMNKKAQGAVKTANHITAWDLYPGDIIDYQSLAHRSGGSDRTAVIEILHRLNESRSDISLLSYELGIEDILAQYTALSDMTLESMSGQTSEIKKLEYSSIGSINLKITSEISIRQVSGNTSRARSSPIGVELTNTGADLHAGFLIGHRKNTQGEGAARSAIGTGLTPRLTGGTYDSPNIVSVDTIGFPSSGNLILNDVSHISYTGKTSATFTGVSLQAGAAIPTGTGALSIRLLRSRGHEIRENKGKIVRRLL